MSGSLAHWIRARIGAGAVENRADISTFVLYTVLTMTALVTAVFLALTTVLAEFELLPVSYATAIHLGSLKTLLIAASVTALLACLASMAIQEMLVTRAEHRRRKELDPLSGLLKRDAFLDFMHMTKVRGFLVLLDIDHFRIVNERYGRDAGDAVIAALAEDLRRTFRSPHIICRYGGEEFAVLFTGMDYDDCLLGIEEVRRSIGSRSIRVGTRAFSVTTSAGVADFREDRSPAVALKVADHALYLAKSLGRDRTVHESETEQLLAPSRRSDTVRRRKSGKNSRARAVKPSPAERHAGDALRPAQSSG
ncbi:GGDEF domain-containing protein [Sinorhizobium sp. BG8]|uniref:GGDEF domain-containing protein n=1 Tax=Sinorhizobium sp. BG8 TaxID=2613773 RepID=UPI00193C915B|nr:GGDEF domain-containing protein [Sinorhizobium sp. BG8]